MYKKDFPILQNNIIYLDNASTTQKPAFVIDEVNTFIKKSYSNIHRGVYKISEESETIYENSKKEFSKIINANKKEIIYTYNATYAFNILIGALEYSQLLKKGDIILLSIYEHHANIVPWQLLEKKIGIKIIFININKDYQLDIEDFKKKYTEKVKIVSLSAASNVTGTITDLDSISKLLRPETLFFIDASQYLPHFKLDVKKLRCDALIATGHKMLAYTGIGMLFIKNTLLEKIHPHISGGGAIEEVSTQTYKLKSNYEKFEPGTPNIIGAVSLLKALEYMENIGYSNIHSYEEEIISYCLKYFKQYEENISLIGNTNSKERVGVFSFTLKNKKSPSEIADLLSLENICIRSGGHCTHPLFEYLKIDGACRMSCYIYTTKQDIDMFFNSLEKSF